MQLHSDAGQKIDDDLCVLSTRTLVHQADLPGPVQTTTLTSPGTCPSHPKVPNLAVIPAQKCLTFQPKPQNKSPQGSSSSAKTPRPHLPSPNPAPLFNPQTLPPLPADRPIVRFITKVPLCIQLSPHPLSTPFLSSESAQPQSPRPLQIGTHSSIFSANPNRPSIPPANVLNHESREMHVSITRALEEP